MNIKNEIDPYQLFLFDFDGTLVNTEELHYKAYLKMCSDRGFPLEWDERTYMRHAAHTATGIKEGIYKELPALQHEEPHWDILYQEKKRAYMELLQGGEVFLMPGVEELLKKLEQKGVKRCVVTHSPLEQIALIRSQHPILNSISEWITREDYSQPKPSPECYEKALAKLKAPGERCIGFEDSPRGLKALLKTEAEAVLLSTHFDPFEIKQLSEEAGRTFFYFPSFVSIFDLN
jgi:beta-phosphoglucomutase